MAKGGGQRAKGGGRRVKGLARSVVAHRTLRPPPLALRSLLPAGVAGNDQEHDGAGNQVHGGGEDCKAGRGG